ncbi:phenylalanine--tRNA ligase beta subunit-related protein [Peribacillus butanolivorans]|uniref:B3/B4 domain-containing protein n=1 Tax=Peribacillus butanolivorans TaxID=421767 RepID=UPI00207C9F31|nr:phenylalanine--tRNA ligase beta subunit-related protein [Peribacillus butanolivorans]MCO0597462.1 phenylalanine--tRNA ligase beta subunit-related protein [Peribacillus butanolivorans]
MEINISANLSSKIPDFKVGIITYENIEVGPSPQMVKGRLQLFQEALFFDLDEKELTDFPGIKEWRKIFKTTGTNPSRYRPSVEALYRRVKKQNYLTSIHSAIDLNNFFSLLYEVPIGIYDADKLTGDISIKIGESTDEYNGLNGRLNSMDNMITSADRDGAFGSPYVDSERTKVTEETKKAIQIIYLQPKTPIKEAHQLTESLMKMFLEIHGGEGTYSILEV